MSKDMLTDAQVEEEILRLQESEAVKLAKKYDNIKQARRRYLYALRNRERVGKQLMEDGYTLDNIGMLMQGEKLV